LNVAKESRSVTPQSELQDRLYQSTGVEHSWQTDRHTGETQVTVSDKVYLTSLWYKSHFWHIRDRSLQCKVEGLVLHTSCYVNWCMEQQSFC